jgi:hypothetical protein
MYAQSASSFLTLLWLFVCMFISRNKYDINANICSTQQTSLKARLIVGLTGQYSWWIERESERANLQHMHVNESLLSRMRWINVFNVDIYWYICRTNNVSFPIGVSREDARITIDFYRSNVVKYSFFKQDLHKIGTVWENNRFMSSYTKMKSWQARVYIRWILIKLIAAHEI